ncbi:MAG: hypothetical protein K2Q21_07250 [Chitinophagaceae bacterium]|nr:hypothetical protein [Chitinophagaceae bacterium]
MTVKKIVLSILIVLIAINSFAQKKSFLKLKAFERSYISGKAIVPEISIGNQEVRSESTAAAPEYFIYLIAYKMPLVKFQKLWIKQQSYLATMQKLSQNPVTIQNGKHIDTLVQYDCATIWQIKIKGVDKTGAKPKNTIADQVKGNDLVLRVTDKEGNFYTRNIKKISVLEADRGQ